MANFLENGFWSHHRKTNLNIFVKISPNPSFTQEKMNFMPWNSWILTRTEYFALTSQIFLIFLSHNFVIFRIKQKLQCVPSSNNQKIGQILKPYHIRIQKNPTWGLATLVNYVFFCYFQKVFLSRQNPVPKIMSPLITHHVLVNLYLVIFCGTLALFHLPMKSRPK